MKNKTVDELLAFLQELSMVRVEAYGGYPDDVAVVGDHIVVATLDPAKECNAPLLEIHTLSELMALFQEAKCLVEQNEAEHLRDAWHELQLASEKERVT